MNKPKYLLHLGNAVEGNYTASEVGALLTEIETDIEEGYELTASEQSLWDTLNKKIINDTLIYKENE